MYFLTSKKNQTGRSYHYLRRNKCIDGKSVRDKEIYLGTADRIYELINQIKEIKGSKTYEFGLSVACIKIMHQTGILKILKKNLDYKIRGIPCWVLALLIILNKIIEPKSKRALSKWYRKSVVSKIMLIDPGKLISQIFFDSLRSTNEKKIRNVELKIARQIKKLVSFDSLLCDFTNIDTYIHTHENNTLPQRGKSKSGKKRIRIVNLGLIVTRQYSIPVLHRTYPGNINDVTEFSNVLRDLEKKKSLFMPNPKHKVTLMFDKGNNSPENINDLDDMGYFFVGRLKPTSYPKLLDVPLTRFKHVYKYNNRVLSYSKRMKVYGRERVVVVTLDLDTYKAELDELHELIERRKDEVMSTQNHINTRYKKKNSCYWDDENKIKNKIEKILNKKPTEGLFKYSFKKQNRQIKIDVKLNKEKYNSIKNILGKYIIFSNRNWNQDQIIKAYRDQYKIEFEYRTIKGNRIKIKPFNHWTDDSIKADNFFSVIALQVMNLLVKDVKKKGISLSKDEILDELQNISMNYYTYKDDKEFNILNDFDTKEEELIFRKLNLKKVNVAALLKIKQ